jgi:hypothetical protein
MMTKDRKDLLCTLNANAVKQLRRAAEATK